MNVKKFIFCVFISLTYKSIGQQIEPYSLIVLSPFQYNPGYAGLDDKIIIQGSFRDQWLKVPGNPSSKYFLLDAPIPALGSGIGLKIQEDQFGAGKLLSLGFNVSYAKNLSKNSVLSLGVGVIHQRYGLNGSLLRTPGGNYSATLTDHQDNLLSNGEISMNGLGYEGGIYLKTNFLEAGLSGTNLLPVRFSQQNFGITLKPHFTFSTRAFIPLNTQLIIQPGVLFRYVQSAMQLDTYILGNIMEKFTLGGGLRGYNPNSLDGLMAIGGIQITENISFFYTYTIPLSPISTSTTGSHEIMMRYTINQKLGKGILPPIIYNPRNL
jgi:type IX secretion system PorP/SprF family membrane protein